MERRVLLKTNLGRKSSVRHIKKFAKDKFMHMGLSQMEARILRVKLDLKLTSIISVALRQRKDYFIINSGIRGKGPQREKASNQRFTR